MSAHRRHPSGASPGRSATASATRKRAAPRCCRLKPFDPSGPSSQGPAYPSPPLPQSNQANRGARPSAIENLRRYSSISSPSGRPSIDARDVRAALAEYRAGDRFEFTS